MAELNILEDIASTVLRGMTDKEMSPERLAKDAGIGVAELDAMTMEKCDDLFSVMKVLALLDSELIVIPKED